jgi:nicotinamidase-related amidase
MLAHAASRGYALKPLLSNHSQPVFALQRDECVVVLLDMQAAMLARLSQTQRDRVLGHVLTLTTAARTLQIPMLWSTLDAHANGQTHAPLAERLSRMGLQPIDRRSFSALAEEGFKDALQSSGRTQVLLCGLEAHVSVMQTARDLVAAEYHTQVVVDAVESPCWGDLAMDQKSLTLDMLKARGAWLTSTEMSLCELLAETGSTEYKAVMQLLPK